MKNRLFLAAGFAALMAAAPSAANADTAAANADTAPSSIPSTVPGCAAAPCSVKLTGPQMLAAAEQLIQNKDFVNAKPLVDALGLAPEYQFQHRFLKGFLAVETGDLEGAETMFRKILDDDPKQTRVRLELARVMMLRGKEGSASYHFRLAQQDKDLPEDIKQTVRGIRGILRNQRSWSVNLDLGIAPDTNINSATSAETVNINFGPFQLPLTLDENARKQSGIGQTAGLSAGLRLRANEKLALLIDGDARLVNYKGKVADDLQTQIAIGPELRIGESSSLSFQALGEQRWRGGERANTDFGARIGFQKILNEGQRIGLSIDGRNTDSGFSPAYSGWQIGSNLTYERVIGRAFIASASLFGRKDILDSQSFSNVSYGGSLGIGGELPLGINAGLSASVSQALFDAPQFIYSSDARKDLRLFGRAYAGIRAFKMFGFSPSIEYNFSQIDSNYLLYESTRHRVNFKLARYF
ncbi:surface lipoprotein assembly modifier [Sphingorhabdus arenilitoris]|uniref:Surface lipoprotein assembly modifier n=1 Tax=Sphingorhabdus arenilitoris TaxID=1490041 RepID=A0ABV8RI16_9SPHN